MAISRSQKASVLGKYIGGVNPSNVPTGDTSGVLIGGKPAVDYVRSSRGGGGGGGGGSSGSSAPASNGGTEAVLTQTGIITAPASQVATKGITAESIRKQAIQIQSARQQQEQRQAIIDSARTDIRSSQRGTIDPTQLTIQQKIREDIKARGQFATDWLISPIKPLEKIKQEVQKGGTARLIQTPVGVGANVLAETSAEFIPQSVLDIMLTAGTIGAYSYGSPIIRTAISGYSAISGTSAVLNPKLTRGERIAGGLTAGLGLFGTAYELYPYARGIKARLSPDYMSVKTQPEGFKAIESDALTIGLIPEKSPAKTGITGGVDLPYYSPLKRGGFSVKQSEKALFLGENQILATSQRSFFKPGKNIPIEREFFTTPQEPTLKIPETRISRLGLSDLFKMTKPGEISFGLPTKAQIGLTIADVKRIESSKAFRIGTTSELEAIKSFGTITDIENIGITSIKGQGVDIFSFKIGKGKGGKSSVSPSLSTITTRTTSAYGILSGIGLVSAKTTETKTPTLKQVLSYPTTTKISKPTQPKTYGKSPSIQITPSYTEPSIYSIMGGSSPEIRRTTPKNKPTIPIRRTTPRNYYSTPKQPKRTSFKSVMQVPRGVFSVSIRRGGRFKPVGIYGSYNKAFERGLFGVRTTLARSFRITGIPGGENLPRDIYLSRKEPRTYIERGKFSLNKLTEVGEIQYFRRRKPKRTSKVRRTKKVKRRARNFISDLI